MARAALKAKRRVVRRETRGRRRAPAPADTRARLLAAGLALAQSGGLRRLTVRGLAAAADVNLGTFVYHFGTRDAFVGELIEHWYAPFYARLQTTVDRNDAPLARLRALLVELAGFLIDNRVFLTHVILDAAAGEAGARAFTQSLAGRHPALVLQAIGEAQQAGALAAGNPLHQMMFFFASLGAPILVLGGLAASGLFDKSLAARVLPIVLDRVAAETRIDWALRGLASAPERTRKVR